MHSGIGQLITGGQHCGNKNAEDETVVTIKIKIAGQDPPNTTILTLALSHLPPGVEHTHTAKHRLTKDMADYPFQTLLP